MQWNIELKKVLEISGRSSVITVVSSVVCLVSLKKKEISAKLYTFDLYILT